MICADFLKIFAPALSILAPRFGNFRPFPLSGFARRWQMPRLYPLSPPCASKIFSRILFAKRGILTVKRKARGTPDPFRSAAQGYGVKPDPFRMAPAAQAGGTEMTDKKSGEELLAEVYRNTRYALASIADILPETEDERLREELKQMHDGYEHISGKAAALAKERGIELKDPGPLKRAMLWGSVKMNALKDDSRAHIAEMLTQGTVMGITALTRSLGESERADEDIRAVADELLLLEQQYEQAMKSYIY